MAQQMMWDLDEMILEVERNNAPAWTGAPLHFHTSYHSPAELLDAWDRWCYLNGHFDSLRLSHMWHPPAGFGAGNTNTPGHSLLLFGVDLRCNHWGVDLDFCVGSLLYQAICAECEWNSIGSEQDVVEAWHDHAWPGWRELPAVPTKVQSTGHEGGNSKGRTRKWIETHYPAEWLVNGAPVVTERSNGATRHVPGRALFGGYDLGTPAHVPE